MSNWLTCPTVLFISRHVRTSFHKVLEHLLLKAQVPEKRVNVRGVFVRFSGVP